MTFITHGFRVSMVLDVRKRVQDLGSPLRFILRRSSLVECVSVLHGTCLQCVENFFNPSAGVSKWAGTRYFYPSEIVYSTGRNY